MVYPIIEDYSLYLHTKRKVNSLTIERYGRVLRKFRDFLKKDLLKATKDDIKAYADTLSNNKPSYRIFQLKVIRTFYNWLNKEGKIKRNPVASADIPEQITILPQPLNKKELERLLLAIDPKTPAGRRNKLLFSVMYCTGARISEVINIQVKDINPAESSLTIYGKKDKERLVYLNPDLLSGLMIYIYENRIKNYIFLSKYGNRLCVRQVQLDVKKYAKLAGIPADKVTPHKIRHSTATHLVQNGYSINGIGSLLGHSSTATTAIYTQVARDDLKKMQQSLNIPL